MTVRGTIPQRLGLEPGARVVTKLIDAASVFTRVDAGQVVRTYGGPCDVLLIAVPEGEGTVFEARLWHELGREDDGDES